MDIYIMQVVYTYSTAEHALKNIKVYYRLLNEIPMGNLRFGERLVWTLDGNCSLITVQLYQSTRLVVQTHVDNMSKMFS